jgi:hypothetical protein
MLESEDVPYDLWLTADMVTLDDPTLDHSALLFWPFAVSSS